jgi:hypothetical protein
MKIFNYIRIGLAVIGFIMAFSAISTSDYYTMVIMGKEPAYIWWIAAVGFAMMLPQFAHSIISDIKESKNAVHR